MLLQFALDELYTGPTTVQGGETVLHLFSNPKQQSHIPKEIKFSILQKEFIHLFEDGHRWRRFINKDQ